MKEKIKIFFMYIIPLFIALKFIPKLDYVTLFNNNPSDYINIGFTISISIAGFLFTAISLLIALIDKDRLKLLWDYDYFDNFKICCLTGILVCTFNMCLIFLFPIILSLKITSNLLIHTITVNTVYSCCIFVLATLELFIMLKYTKTREKRKANVEKIISENKKDY